MGVCKGGGLLSNASIRIKIGWTAIFRTPRTPPLLTLWRERWWRRDLQVNFNFCLWLFVTSERLDRFWHSCNEQLRLFELFILVMSVLKIAADRPKLWPKTHTVRMGEIEQSKTLESYVHLLLWEHVDVLPNSRKCNRTPSHIPPKGLVTKIMVGHNFRIRLPDTSNGY